MAKKTRRVFVYLTCDECKHRNYTTTKSRDMEGSLALRKFCSWCKKTTLHKEEKIDKKRKEKDRVQSRFTKSKKSLKKSQKKSEKK